MTFIWEDVLFYEDKGITEEPEEKKKEEQKETKEKEEETKEKQEVTGKEEKREDKEEIEKTEETTEELIEKPEEKSEDKEITKKPEEEKEETKEEKTQPETEEKKKEEITEKPRSKETKEETTEEKQDKKKAEQETEDKEITEEPEEKKEGETKETETEEKQEPVKKGLFSRIHQSIVTKKISENQFEDLFWELEITMLENNVAVEVIEKIKDDLKQELVEKPIPRNKIESTILKTLRTSIEEILDQRTFDIFKEMEKKKPYVICFIGVNGSGKTTTIAKLTHLLQKNNKSVVLAAADTFRAAAIDQLTQHAQNLNTKIIKHDYGHDSAAVAYDAVKHAEAKDRDVVLIDTAGRLHSNKNLLDELKKVINVSKPDIKLFVGESITGNDCIEQAQQFNDAVGIDGIILSKADIDEKGGAAISVSYVTGKPILFMGNGQEYDDLEIFDKEKLLESLNL
ncbi:MAG: signal recognition particle-docking protein FtsY [Candidatus Woesearchaeota archaeon]